MIAVSLCFFQIYNSSIISSQTLLMNLSGWHTMRQPLKSSGGYFVIHFQTDNLVNKAGWSASFSFGKFHSQKIYLLTLYHMTKMETCLPRQFIIM